ncbi:MAG: hypothetical protein JWO89_1483, partial [Verrucomicrobiaceae bacterium]|nr:hypothetical protein [Verrucomicrobiaceae bacterium]
MIARYLLLLFATAVFARADIEITVSPEGPITSLQAARDELRTQRKTGQGGPATIWIKTGLYEQTGIVNLEATDSDLTIRAAKDAKPRFNGAVKIKGFKSYKDSIVQAEVSKLLVKGVKHRQVLFDDERLILARWPNFDAKDPLYGGWAIVDSIPKKDIDTHVWKSEMYVKPQDLRTWTHPEDVELDIFAMYGWWNFIERVKSLDPQTRKLTLARPCSYDLHPHNRYHLQNALEELDAPGEWFIDVRTGTLYVWPPAPLEKHTVKLVTLSNFIKIGAGAKNITIRGLSFTGSNGTAITMDKAEHCTVAGCTFTTIGDFGGNGISISGGTDNAALGNDMSYIGSNGISLSGGDRLTLTACNNRADNNHIHHMGVFNKNACGVSAGGAGIQITHNLIHDGPRMGVQMGGNNITVEYNHLHHLVMETQDGGAIYTGGRDWISSRGSKWNYNRIHDIVGIGQESDGLKHPWFTFGLYPDDNTGGVDMIGNLVYRCAWTPIHMHNSRDCVVENNIFAFGAKFQFDLHGWSKEQRFWIDHSPTMIKGYESVMNQPAWKGMRGMELHPRDAFREDGTMMSGDVVKHNIMYGDQSDAKYGDIRNCTPQWNTIDENLAWNSGHPILTGINKMGKDIGEPLLTENFEKTGDGDRPPGWGFNSMPNKKVLCIVQHGQLEVDAGTSEDPQNNHTVFHGPDVPMKFGAAYRVRLRVKSSEPTGKITLALAAYKGGAGYWQASGTNVKLTN